MGPRFWPFFTILLKVSSFHFSYICISWHKRFKLVSSEYSGLLLSKNIRCGGVMVVYHGELTPVCGNTIKMCILGPSWRHLVSMPPSLEGSSLGSAVKLLQWIWANKLDLVNYKPKSWVFLTTCSKPIIVMSLFCHMIYTCSCAP